MTTPCANSSAWVIRGDVGHGVRYLNERIAIHPRLWGKEDVHFEPVHYLRLLERKPGALDHARPLSDIGAYSELLAGAGGVR